MQAYAWLEVDLSIRVYFLISHQLLCEISSTGGSTFCVMENHHPSLCNSSWLFNNDLCKAIKSWNNKNLHHITNESYDKGYNDPTFSITIAIKQRRLKWLRKSLTEQSFSYSKAYMMLKYQFQNGREGNAFEDIPEDFSWQDLINTQNPEEP